MLSSGSLSRILLGFWHPFLSFFRGTSAENVVMRNDAVRITVRNPIRILAYLPFFFPGELLNVVLYIGHVVVGGVPGFLQRTPLAFGHCVTLLSLKQKESARTFIEMGKDSNPVLDCSRVAAAQRMLKRLLLAV